MMELYIVTTLYWKSYFQTSYFPSYSQKFEKKKNTCKVKRRLEKTRSGDKNIR